MPQQLSLDPRSHRGRLRVLLVVTSTDWGKMMSLHFMPLAFCPLFEEEEKILDISVQSVISSSPYKANNFFQKNPVELVFNQTNVRDVFFDGFLSPFQPNLVNYCLLCIKKSKPCIRVYHNVWLFCIFVLWKSYKICTPCTVTCYLLQNICVDSLLFVDYIFIVFVI